MSKPFKGIINFDIGEWAPDREPYTQPIAPPGSPWAFAGGTIHKAVVDVSGEPFVDLAEEAQMAFARD
jgi:hypothetical protein